MGMVSRPRITARHVQWGGRGHRSMLASRAGIVGILSISSAEKYLGFDKSKKVIP